MTNLCKKLLEHLDGKTLATAESCTGGMIGAALTAVPGASAIYKGGVISYWSQVKQEVLRVDGGDLERLGPVSMQVAGAMAQGVRKLLRTDVAVSVTGLAGPEGDAFGYPVGTVFVGLDTGRRTLSRQYRFSGDRDAVRVQAARAALELILEET